MASSVAHPKPNRLFLKQNKAYNLGLLLTKRAHYLDAFDRFKSLVQHNPGLLSDMLIPLYKLLMVREKDLGLRQLIAELYICCNRENEALMELEDNLIQDPDHHNTYLILSKIYKNAKNKNQINQLFELAFSQGRDDAIITDHLSSVYLDAGQVDKAILLFEFLVSKHKQNVYYSKTLAELYCQEQRFEKAADMYLQLSDIAPQHSSEAASRCESLLAFAPDNRQLREKVIALLVKSCQPAPCLAHLYQLLSIAPDSSAFGLTVLKDLLDLAPQHLDIMQCKTHFLIHDERPVEALTIVQEILALPSPPLDRCLEDIATIESKAPGLYLAKEIKVNIYILQKKHPDALTLLKNLMTQEGADLEQLSHYLDLILQAGTSQYLEALCTQGTLLYLMGKPSQSESKLQACLGTDLDFEARLTLAKIRLDAENRPEAKKQLLDCLKHKPFHAETLSLLKAVVNNSLEIDIQARLADSPKKQQAQHWFKLGLQFLRQGRRLNALEHFQKITHAPVLQQKAQILMGRCFMEMGRFDMSINQYNQLLQSVTDDQDLSNTIRYLQSINYAHIGKRQQGLQLLEEILENDVDFHNLSSMIDLFRHTGLQDLRGRTVSACFHHDELYLVCIPNMDHQSATSTSFGIPHNNHAVDFILKQQYKAAEEELELAENVESELLSIYCNRAMVHLLQNESKAAIQKLHLALSLNAQSDIPYLNLGLVALKEQDYETALWHFQKTTQLNPKNALAWINLGDSYWQLNQCEQAFIAWEKAHHLHLFFHITQNRTHFLHQQAFNFKHWLNDFKNDFAPMLPKTLPTLDAPLFTQTSAQSPDIVQTLPLFG